MKQGWLNNIEPFILLSEFDKLHLVVFSKNELTSIQIHLDDSISQNLTLIF